MPDDRNTYPVAIVVTGIIEGIDSKDAHSAAREILSRTFRQDHGNTLSTKKIRTTDLVWTLNIDDVDTLHEMFHRQKMTIEVSPINNNKE